MAFASKQTLRLLCLGPLLLLPLNGYLTGASALDWWLIWGAITVFLPMFWWIFGLSGVKAVIPLTGLTLMGVVLTPLNPTACLFFGYAGATVGFLGRSSWSLAALAIITVAIAIEVMVFGLSLGFWATTTLFTVVFGGYCIHWSETNRTNELLRRKQSEIERLAKVAERERIARDLHDLLGHTLSVSVLKARVAAKLIHRDPARAHREVEEIERISREALGQVREAVQGYRKAGIVEEFDNARSALYTANVKSSFEIDEEATKAPSQIANVLAMVLRETITNVIRHADATVCEVELVSVEEAVELKVTDDGAGGTFVEGAGLTGMRERVELLGGSMQIDSASGTSVRVRLPSLIGPRNIDDGTVKDVA
ncbi:MAG: sensor histidine kinase [Gammaproteobacteria bacterium]|nr:sensor histidine kinase [Gammaproteobacteria bacterium]